MRAAPKRTAGQKIVPTATISRPDAIPNERRQPAKGSVPKNPLMVKETGVDHMKGVAADFKSLLAEKDEILVELKAGLEHLKENFVSLDKTIDVSQLQRQENQATDLDSLRQVAKSSEEREASFNSLSNTCRGTIGDMATILAEWESKASKGNALQRLYDRLVQNAKKSLRMQDERAIAEHAKLSGRKKSQVDQMDRFKKQFYPMRIRFEKISGKGTTLRKQSKTLDARLKQMTKNDPVEDKAEVNSSEPPAVQNTVAKLQRNGTFTILPNGERQNQITLEDPQLGVEQAQESLEPRIPVLDGSVTKSHGQKLKKGAAGKFTSQTLSKVATSSDPANVETQQVQMTMSGYDSNSDCTTKFRKVVYSGKGIDMNVMSEAKRILAVHQNGVTQEVEETDEEFKLRKVLVKRAADLLQMMENAEFVRVSSMPSGHVLKIKDKLVEEEMTTAQTVFSQITNLVTRNQR